MEEQVKNEGLLDWQIDERIESIKNRNREIERLEDIAAKRKQDIELRLEHEVTKLKNQNHYDISTIREAVMQSEDKRETKTSFKKKFVSGEAIIKKGSQSVKKPIKKQYDSLFEVYPEFKKVKEDYDLNWKELKSRLQIVDGKIIDAETGEEMSQHFEIEDKEESVEIK